ncbi:MAG: 3-octaprenyl-4-hydroxybenzoate carboxy-lyase [Blastopirellula sp.]|nr:MAG: 3-octaprenyl-4-hydroxybenzoate carboxy-lyase [Blastopirellula sp.]
MGYRSLRQCVTDLEKNGHLVRIEDEIDAQLEAAEIQRRVYASGGPAVLFTNVKGCQFPMVSNLFGTMERARFMFRDTLESVRRLIELKIDPSQLMKHPLRYAASPFSALRMLPKKCGKGAVLENEISLDQLPNMVSWPDDGGPYVTLPQVYTEDVRTPGLMKSNLGMYRVQLAGNEYRTNKEVGLHYQIHRGIGVHHAAALAAGKPLKVNIFVGGTPAMTLAAVMPLPEGLSELQFAGALAGHRIPMVGKQVDLPIYADADFCISGEIDPAGLKPEGPFGDHLGYYSLAHPFPVMRIKKVYHRHDAIWPFTVVGRPPQEDTTFGALIHEITGPVIPTVIPGLKAVNAVDAAGVHPLLLAIGSERYVPYEETTRPKELLTQANAILGQGQMSLAKYLMIVSAQDDEKLDVEDIASVFQHLLQRIDLRRDLHFQTETTIDTLDYSSGQFNHGSKLVMAAVGKPIRELRTELPSDLKVPDNFREPKICLPGILAITGPKFTEDIEASRKAIDKLTSSLASMDQNSLKGFPLILVVDDSPFTSTSLNNLVWTTFTRSNPADDVHGVNAFIERKHWGCTGPMLIDARIKPWHAPPLVEDPEVTKRVDALAAKGGPLARYL